MSFLNSAGGYIVPFLIVLTVLVFVHELGHYWVARRNGVKVEVFSIGFGPELFGWNDRAGTRWKVSLVPLGGYVRMFGEHDLDQPAGPEASVAPDRRGESFQHKSLRQRAAIVFAGPAANFLFALVIYIGLFQVWGQPFTPPDVTGIVAGSAAEQAGLQTGDRILKVNGQTIERFEDIQRAVQLNLDQPLDILLLRSGSEMTVRATPVVVEDVDPFGNRARVARLGVRGQGVTFVRRGPAEAAWRGVTEVYQQTAGTLYAIAQMVGGRRTTDEIGGPIRIAQMSGDVAQGGLPSMLMFMAILSINLGLINLFPVPMLDGGHLLFYAAEAIRGRPLGPRAQEYGFRIGLALVLTLMVFATWNDIVNLRVVEYIVGLVS